MKIAQVAPLWETIPPTYYGGTERIVYGLTEGLVNLGHNVSLYAAGDSKTSAQLHSVYPRPLFRDGIPWTNLMYPLLNIASAFESESEFDVIHVHLNKSSDYLALPLAQRIKQKVIFTMHFCYPTLKGLNDRGEVLSHYKDLQYVSISDAQRKGGEHLNWLATCYNGIDESNYTYSEKTKDYLLWFGKFNPDKGPHNAIKVAKKLGKKLKLAGAVDKLDKTDFEYYKKEIEPLFDNKQIEYLGEIDDKQKSDLIGGAIAFLNPIQWNEPFGLVMVESLACGTPVISFINGAAPEIIEDGVSGFLVKSIDDMCARVKDIEKINRANCRKRVEQYFTHKTMTDSYLKVYNTLL